MPAPSLLRRRRKTKRLGGAIAPLVRAGLALRMQHGMCTASSIESISVLIELMGNAGAQARAVTVTG